MTKRDITIASGRYARRKGLIRDVLICFEDIPAITTLIAVYAVLVVAFFENMQLERLQANVYLSSQFPVITSSAKMVEVQISTPMI